MKEPINKLINIKAVETITGITQHVIRAWENRYKAIVPMRTESNHRLYSNEQIEKLHLLKKLTENSYSISRIAHYDKTQLSALINELEPTLVNKKDETPSYNEIINNCITYTQSYQTKEIEETLELAVQEFGQFIFLKEIIEPILIRVGELWTKGELRVSHEHFIAAVIKNTLINLMSANKVSSDAKSIILATTSGELHEMGCLIGGVIASSFGLKTVYLGTSLPAEEIIFSTKRSNAVIVFLGLVYPVNKEETSSIIKRINKYTDLNCNIVVAGNSATLNHFNDLQKINGIHFLKSQSEFIEFLQSISGQI